MIELSNTSSKELVKLLSRGADIIYGHNPTPREQNVARKMRLMRGSIERKIK